METIELFNYIKIIQLFIDANTKTIAFIIKLNPQIAHRMTNSALKGAKFDFCSERLINPAASCKYTIHSKSKAAS